MLCVACGNNDAWLELPDPHPSRSITTSGMLSETPLAKSHCGHCGMVQRTRSPFLGLTDFYEKNYALYYDRPGNEGFSTTRYKQIAAWVGASMKFKPASVLEVGCGRGWAMREMAKVFPGAVVKGLEPAEANSAAGREAGLDIATCRLEDYPVSKPGFDMIYSNHVIQHVVDPVAFLKQHAALLSDDGTALVTVQDARLPTNELLYSDQNYSFMPRHFLPLAEKAGLSLVGLVIAPDDQDGVRHSQMAILKKRGTAIATRSIPDVKSLDDLYKARRDYLLAWPSLDRDLIDATAEAARVFNFGAGMFSFILSCYAPNYWNRVDSCLVDGQASEFFGKAVVDPGTVQFGLGDMIVLGIRPAVQPMIAERLSRLGAKIVRWDDRVSA